MAEVLLELGDEVHLEQAKAPRSLMALFSLPPRRHQLSKNQNYP